MNRKSKTLSVTSLWSRLQTWWLNSTGAPGRQTSPRRRFAIGGEGLEDRQLLSAPQALYGLQGSTVTVLNPSTGSLKSYSGMYYSNGQFGLVVLDR